MMFDQIQKNIFNQDSILDLKNIPQDSSAISVEVDPMLKVNDNINSFDDYISDYFAIWKNIPSDFNPALPSRLEIGDYEYNFASHLDDWYDLLVDNANMSSLSDDPQKFMVTTSADLRYLPTNSPSYHNPLDAGQGYHFDNIQQNLLRIGEPLLVFHYSKDQKYAFVLTNAKAYGFVAVNHIAKVTQELALGLMNSDYVMIASDDTALYYKDDYVTSLDMGAILPIANGDLKLPVRNIDGGLDLITVKADHKNIIKTPLEFNLANVKLIVDKLIDKPYGWAGHLGNRDCAQLTKDYFAVFGKLIPIFSAEQSKVGEIIDLSSYGKMQKLAKIKSLPIYKTILYAKGHVVIYMGEYNKLPIIFHARWGVPLYDSTFNEYRYIIGKSVLTSLEFGSDLAGFDLKHSSFLESISSASIVI
jgi:hypothetical protein